MKQKLLYLCHRIPYPPNKGDKITTCNILKFLNRHFEVYLGCFIDDPYDRRYLDDVRALCKEACFVDLHPLSAKLKGLSALFSDKPITVPHYHSAKLQHWVSDAVTKHKIDTAFIYSGCMAQYVLREEMQGLHKVMHFADIDSDKWRQYAEKANPLMRWVYLREQRTLAQYEKHVANKFSASCFISDTEAAMFRDMVAEPVQNKIKTLGNGIDSDFFSPAAEPNLCENYALQDQNYIVFTGAMDYRPNIDAVGWFAKHIWPKVTRRIPEAKFYIVGSSPPKQVVSLQKHTGIIVTGRVEDIRPYILHAKAAVAPMQIARGIQNKILEAMAMERPVITTHLGMEGLEGYPDKELCVADSPERIADWLIAKLEQPPYPAKLSRSWLMDHYSWEARLSPLLDYLEASR